MLKLTRLNHHLIAINPDHISWAEATPDTTLCLLNGEKIIVRESIDELIDRVVQFRRLLRVPAIDDVQHGEPLEGDPPRLVPGVFRGARRGGVGNERSSLGAAARGSPSRGGEER